jgi:hypothetical protein
VGVEEQALALRTDWEPAAVEAEAKKWLSEIEGFAVTDQDALDQLTEVLTDTHTKLGLVAAARELDIRDDLDRLENKRAFWKPGVQALEALKGALKEKIRKGEIALQRATEQALEAAARDGGDVVAIAEAAPRAKGVAHTESWTYRVLDESVVPREYLTINHAKIDQHVRKNKGSTCIPGVEAYAKKELRMSGRRG